MQLRRFIAQTALTAISLFTFYFLILTPHPVSAVEPFPPFSVEGNPDEAYLLDEIFPLFRYISPPLLKVYENRDRSRNYEPLEVCSPVAQNDFRDYECNNQGDACTGGDINVCFRNGGGLAYTANSTSGTCRYSVPQNDWVEGQLYTGTCEYRQRPSLSGELRATDFSTPETVVYNKLQKENYYYGGAGIPSNPITSGTHRLGLSLGEQAVKQALVLRRARETQTTFQDTGEWPLGWVDWGFITDNGKTLIEIYQSLPPDIKSAATVIAEARDDFYLSAGNIDPAVRSDASREERYIELKVRQTLASKPTPQWVVDLLQSPVYPPSFRQGYARGSICLWDRCCPGLNCPFPSDSLGTSQALYADPSVSQAFIAALDDLFLHYTLDEAGRIFRRLAQLNPLVQFVGSASPNAVPSFIHARLESEINDPCLEYVPDKDSFTLGRFGFIMDYANPPTFLDSNNQCPGWEIQPELAKELGGAVPGVSLLSRLIELIWAQSADEIDPVKRHLITIPDAMGQSISELVSPVLLTQDTNSYNRIQTDYNATISNIVDATSDKYLAGKGVPVGHAKRRPGYLTCADPDYSSPLETSIEQYALGTRIGCRDTSLTAQCDPTLFAELLENSGGIPLAVSPQAEAAFNTYIESALTPEVFDVYAQASAETGVPCEVLAGIHFIEGNNSPTASLVSGRQLGTPEPDAGGKVFSTLLETAIYAGEHLKGKVGGTIDDVETLITALSRYNGGGNSNCQLGYPYPIPYAGCPRRFEGEDDPYPVNWLDSRHSEMYLLYCADRTACEPQVFQRPGSFTVALAVYNNFTKNNLVPSPSPSSSPDPGSGNVSGGPLDISPAGTCGEGYIDTALGCLPYAREAFISALLGFVAGISGLISLVVMMVSTFLIMTSAGDPERLKRGKELFMAALTGLLFIVFSVTLLRLIAGDIIKLPGF